MDDSIARSTRAPGRRSFVATLAGCGLTLAAGIAAQLYLLAATRAALLSPKRRDAAEDCR